MLFFSGKFPPPSIGPGLRFQKLVDPPSLHGGVAPVVTAVLSARKEIWSANYSVTTTA